MIEFDRKVLIAEVRSQFRLDWNGIHGAPHWARVFYHGQRIAKLRGADRTVVGLFAFLHDSQRHHDGRDSQHGARAAEYAVTLNGRFFDLSPKRLDLLTAAMRGHSDGGVDRDATVQTCWDSDRLDLGRVGKRPWEGLLSAEAAKLIPRAYAMSLR
jgi:uncharacterized protein